MNLKKKTLTIAGVVALSAAVAIGGTLAYLTASTDEVVNTFTVGKIALDLTEEHPTGGSAKMVPGDVIEKDPIVTVTADSEACWLFVKIAESANLDTYIDYAVAAGWTAVPDHAGYYYRQVDADTAATGADYTILAGDATYTNGMVTVKDVTSAVMGEVTEETQPTLTFTACAVQSAHLDTVAAAFAQVPTGFYEKA